MKRDPADFEVEIARGPNGSRYIAPVVRVPRRTTPGAVVGEGPEMIDARTPERGPRDGIR